MLVILKFKIACFKVQLLLTVSGVIKLIKPLLTIEIFNTHLLSFAVDKIWMQNIYMLLISKINALSVNFGKEHKNLSKVCMQINKLECEILIKFQLFYAVIAQINLLRLSSTMEVSWLTVKC